MRFALPQGFSHGEPFYQYLKDSFDVLYAEGDEAPKCCRWHALPPARPPGRFAALRRFMDYIASHERLWVCRRGDIARHCASMRCTRMRQPDRCWVL